MYQPFPCYPSFSSFFVNQCHRSVTWNLFKKPFFLLFQLLDETFARDKTPFGVPLLFLMHLCIRLVKVFHVWLVQNCPIYNTYRFVLQELRILLGGCLTVMNQWGLITGDGRVIFQECWFYLKFWVGEKDPVQTAVFRDYY